MTNIPTYVHKSLLLLVPLVFFWSVLSTSAYAAEQILSYDVDIDVKRDSSVLVSETILYDFGQDFRHGIFRNIPTNHPQGDTNLFKNRYTDIKILEVQMDGSTVPYVIESSGDTLSLKIGDAYSTITSTHTYRIDYEVNGAISYFEDGLTEFYWNAIGSEWEVPIQEVTIALHDRDSLFESAHACYVGRFGAEEPCEEGQVAGVDTFFIASNLAPYEGVTVAQSLDGQKISRVILERTKVAFFWIPALLIWFTVFSIFVYRYKSRFNPHKTIIAQYEPYEDFKPMYAGLLIDGNLDSKDITAGIVYLAQQGFLKIKKIDTKVMFFFEVDDYEISLLKPVEDIETKFQKEIAKLIFGATPVVGDKVTLQDLKKNTQMQKENITLLAYLRKNIEQDLEDAGFFQIHVQTYVILISIIVGSGMIWAFFSIAGSFLTINAIFTIILLLGSIVILSVAHRRRTVKGYEALWHLSGFRIFLSVTEKERYKFHNAPQKSPEQFMEYLPYAIAFGVEKEWAEVFKDITIPNPDWYDGSGGGHFSATSFATSIGAFSSALTASSNPSSGSGGGGSVGGGGGGGGGGSW